MVRTGPPPPRKPTFVELADAEDRDALTSGLRAARLAAEAEAAVMSRNRYLAHDITEVAAMLLRRYLSQGWL